MKKFWYDGPIGYMVFSGGAEIKKRADEATPGPWSTERHGAPLPGDSWWTVIHHTGQVSRILSTRPCDAEFIAHSRTDVPKLVAALKLAIEAMEENAYQDEYMHFEADLIKILSTDPNS